MTKAEIRKLDRLVRMLEEAASLADKIELQLDNGGYVGCLIGTMADELSVRLEKEAGVAK